jgi:LmbE family N-acetylglucosaminyl deacetylase
VKERIGLDMGDGVLEATLENRRKLIEVVRDLRPAIVLGPYWDDLHPDHAAAGRLLCGVMYPSGFARYPAKGDPFRPNEYLFYMGHTLFLPALIVDVGGFFERKLEAVRCFDSQVNPGREDGPATGISRPEFLPALEGRARHYGRQIGREFGEPFTVRRPVPMDDPVAHYLPFTKIHAGKERVT